MSGIFTIKPKGSFTSKEQKKKEEKQSCSCKPNADGRCCLSKSCGCSRAEVGCSPLCNCKGFKLVCGNSTAPVSAPVPKPAMEPVAGGPPTKKQKGPSNAPFAGQARKLAEDPFAIAKAAAPTGQEATKEAFLARLEAQQRAAAAATASAAPSAGAGGDDVVDLCSDSDDDAPIVAAASKPAGQSAAATQAPAARPAAPAQAPAAGPSTSSFRRDSFDPYNPRQYVPPGGFGALMSGGELCVNETAELQNVDGGWDRGLRACLDTGNEGCTLLVEAAAIRAGLVDPLTGDPVGTFGRCETVEVRGVVAGASERVPLMPAAYRIAGREMRVIVGVTRAQLGCDILVGRKDLLEFERAGFRLSARR